MSARFQLVSAVHLFLLRGGKILLLRRYQTGYEDGNFSVVAGHLDGNETVFEAAMREAREEVGVALAAQDLRAVGVMHRRSTDERIDWFVVCERWDGEVRNAEPEKCDELSWVDPEMLPPNVIPYIRRAIENFRAGRWFDSFGWP
jgi:ADP-ribose pyrophosphatase YjhB (NUDIX family)